MTEDDDLPESWRQSANARRLHREAATDVKSPQIEDASEILSSLKHKMEKLPGIPSTALSQTVVEERGIRRSRRPEWTSQRDRTLEDLYSEWGPDDTAATLFMAANRHLKATGESTFWDVIENADELARHYGRDVAEPEKVARYLEIVVDDIEQRTGSLSIETAAIKFIQARDRLFMLLDATPEMQAAANAYADAWHWLHLEWSGEHESAALAQSAEKGLEGLRVGPHVSRQKGEARKDVVRREYEKLKEKEGPSSKMKSPKHVAGQLLAQVNTALGQLDLGEYTEGTLEKYLRGIIKAG